jgi:hypothetical protein
MLGNGPDPSLTIDGGKPVGDCTFAAREHLRMAKAAAFGLNEVWESSDQLVSEYLAYNHGVDRGACIAEVLTYWFLKGKIKAFAPVDHHDPGGCDQVMGAFHGLYVGVDLTDNADGQFNANQPWTIDQGDQPDPQQAHCIIKVKADGGAWDTWVTWGALQQSTRDWTAACIREAWAVVTTEDEAAKLAMPALISDILDAIAQVDATSQSRHDQSDGSAAFALGWHMASLYRPQYESHPPADRDHLPAIPELDAKHQMELELHELRTLLHTAQPDGDDRDRADALGTSARPTQAELLELHYHILDRLESTDPARASSYQLGTYLYLTCSMPGDGAAGAGTAGAETVLERFSRARMAMLQGWLHQVSTLMPDTAPLVSRSIQNWADWVDANAAPIKQNWSTYRQPVAEALSHQGDSWRGLLCSATTPSISVPIEAWIHAGESLVRTRRATARHVLRWFWPVAVIILAAMGGLLYVVATNASGAAKAWTAIVTVAGGLAAAGAGIRSAALRVVGSLEQSLSRSANLDAEAWSVTWLPVVSTDRSTRRRMRNAGIDPPSAGLNTEQVGGGATAPAPPSRPVAEGRS